jgi:hypothetical protein
VQKFIIFSRPGRNETVDTENRGVSPAPPFPPGGKEQEWLAINALLTAENMLGFGFRYDRLAADD